MPESVLVRFKGKMQPGVDPARPGQRDPAVRHQGRPADGRQAGQEEHLLGPHPGNRRPAGPEGRAGVRAVSDASAERSAAGCTVHLNKEPIIEYLNSNITLMKWMIANGLRRRAHAASAASRRMEAWLADPQLLKGDADAEYAAVIEIDLADIHEPIVACPNDPDDVKTLSAKWPARKIDEVFIGSCMTNIGHFRAASKLLGRQARHPGQAVDRAADQDGRQAAHRGRPLRRARHAPARAWKCRAARCAWATRRRCSEGATVLSTCTRNFPNRLGKNTNVYLGSRRAGRDLLPAGPHPDQGRVHGRHGRARRLPATRSTST